MNLPLLGLTLLVLAALIGGVHTLCLGLRVARLSLALNRVHGRGGWRWAAGGGFVVVPRPRLDRSNRP